MIKELFKFSPFQSRSRKKVNTFDIYDSVQDSEINSSIEENLSYKAVKGVFWMLASLLGSRFLGFISTMILARILAPAEFGQFGFALLVISYLQTVGDLGVGAALIYEQREQKSAPNVSFVINILTGLLWFALIQATAPFVVILFKDPEIIPILRVLSFVFIINAFGNTNDVLLRKGLAFKKRLIPDVSLGLIKGLISVVLAILGYGVWSLVWGQVIGTACATIALWLVFPWSPRIEFPWKLAKQMLGYGWKIVTVNGLAAIVHHLDYVIVGGILGSAAFGYYSLAYKIPELSIVVVIWGVGKVMFPTYSKLQNDIPSLQNMYLGTIRHISLLTIPSGVGIALLGSIIITVVYGDRWTPSIPVLQILALAATIRSLSSNNGDVYNAVGRPDILVKLGLLRTILLVPSLIYGARFGIAGVAVAQLSITCIGTLLSFYIIGRVLSLPMKSVLSVLGPAFGSSTIMLICLYLFNPLVSNTPHAVNLVSSVSFGFIIYLLAIFLLSPGTLRNVKVTIVSSFRKTA